SGHGDPHGQGAQSRHGAQGHRLRRPLPLALAPHTGGGETGPRVRAGQRAEAPGCAGLQAGAPLPPRGLGGRVVHGLGDATDAPARRRAGRAGGDLAPRDGLARARRRPDRARRDAGRERIAGFPRLRRGPRYPSPCAAMRSRRLAVSLPTISSFTSSSERPIMMMASASSRSGVHGEVPSRLATALAKRTKWAGEWRWAKSYSEHSLIACTASSGSIHFSASAMPTRRCAWFTTSSQKSDPIHPPPRSVVTAFSASRSTLATIGLPRS